jgi:hypothetical protein
MDNRDLTSAQLAAVAEVVGRYVRFLNRMLRRMEKRGFPGNDELYRETSRAYDGLRSLLTTLHYLNCRSGVGRHEFKRPEKPLPE